MMRAQTGAFEKSCFQGMATPSLCRQRAYVTKSHAACSQHVGTACTRRVAKAGSLKSSLRQQYVIADTGTAIMPEDSSSQLRAQQMLSREDAAFG